MLAFMIKELFSYFRLLSLDVVLGACVSTLFVAKYLGVDLPSLVVVALGIAVWIIYTADHLLDGSKSRDTPLTLRHQFHQKNSKPILVVLILLMLVGLSLVIQLPMQIIINGSILVACVMLYFVGLKLIGSKPSAYKESLVALAYAFGVFLGPFSLIEIVNYRLLLPLFTIYVLMAFVNLLIFSVYELTIDERDQHTSLVRYVGKSKATYLITVCFILLIILLGYQLIMVKDLDHSSIIIFAMISSLAAINYWKQLFGVGEWYRIVGDAVFYFPLVVLL